MINFILRIFLENQSIVDSKSNTKIIHAFSCGQDSTFLLLLLMHKLRQDANYYIASYKSHDTQPLNLYLEFHFFKLFVVLKTRILNGIIIFINASELKLKEYRYDLLIRELHYYKYESLYLSHSHNDLIESKFVEFIQKSIFSSYPKANFRINSNILLKKWPIAKKKNQNKYLPQKKLHFYYYKKSYNSPKQNKLKNVEKDLDNSISLKNYKLCIYRPLSTLPRSQILNANEEMKLPNQNDKTNFCINYLHNFCRHQIVPLFRFKFGNNFEKSFFQNFSHMSDSSHKKRLFEYSSDIKEIQNINRFRSNKCETILINCQQYRFHEQDRFFAFLLYLNFFYKINLSYKELFFIQNNMTCDSILLIRIRFPQVLLIANYLIVRFSQ